MLCHGVSPDSIVALTFTRKAAGEFFSRIVSQLSESALSSSKASAFAASNNFGQWDMEIAHERLKDLVWQMPHLHLGTLDQFFFKILTNFCFEYNVPDGFQVVDPIDLEREINRLMGQILNERRNKSDAKDLMEILKEATFGVEYSTVAHLLKTITSSFHQLHLECPEELRWGQPDIIWGGESSPFDAEGDAKSRVDRFRTLLKTKSQSEAQWKKWDEVFDFIQAYQPGGELAECFKSLLKNINILINDIESKGKGRLKFVNKNGVEFENASEFQSLLSLIQPVVKAEWFIKLRRTKGLYFLLDNFEKKYDSQLRRRGYIAFSDVLYLLSQGPGLQSGKYACNTGMRLDPDRRLAMDFRLNSTFDHWLLDEFQDTSRNQWNILENLVDEVVQDTSGERSVFVVGDIKQSVYGWRGGDYKLFDFLLERYVRHGESNFLVDSLDKSYRSAPQILAFVNDVFNSESNIQSFLGSSISSQWVWENHTSALDELSGHVAVVGLDKSQAVRSSGVGSDALEALYHLIDNLKPIERRKSCAVLVRRNQDSDLVTRYLRERGLPVSQSMDVPIARDNLLVPAVTSLIQFLIHPDDHFAEWHIKMSPVYSALAIDGDSIDQFHSRNIRKLNTLGLSRWIEWVIKMLEKKAGSADSFHQLRGKQLIDAARRYENSNNNSLDDFLEFMTNFHCQEAGANNEIQVMTMHKSKGLGFDVVLLPQVNVPFASNKGDGMLVERSDGGDINWISQVPAKNISYLNKKIRNVAEKRNQREIFESLCLFYVACTRAKEGLYILTNAKEGSATWGGLVQSGIHNSKQKPESLNRDMGWLPSGCDVLYESGDFPKCVTPSELEKSHETGKAKGRAQCEFDFISNNQNFVVSQRRIAKERASGAGIISCRNLFSKSSLRSRKIGVLVHKLLECVEWISPDNDWEKSLNEIWKNEGLIHLEDFDGCAKKILGLSDNQNFRKVFYKPNEGESICWREKSFELIHNESWISGVMDRVILMKENEKSQISKAIIYDFKTDKNLNPSDYDFQVETYAIALSRIAQIKRDNIEVHLVHVP